MTSRKQMIACALAPAALLAVTTVWAQAPGDVRAGADRPVARAGEGAPQPTSPSGDRKPRGAVTAVLLIGLPALQTELKLSDAQKKTIREMNAGFDERRREATNRLMNLPRGLDQEALLAMIADLRRESEEALARVLDKPQLERLAQVALQLEGPMAVTRPEIAVRLNLADTQLLQIQTLKEQYDALREQLYAAEEAASKLRAATLRQAAVAGSSAARPGPRGETTATKAVTGSGAPKAKLEESDGDRLNRQLGELRARFVRELDKVLTRRQKTVFNQMLGPPFDLAKVQFRGEQSGPNTLPPADAPTFLEPLAPLNGPSPAATAAKGKS
jgi:hypothetical protein